MLYDQRWDAKTKADPFSLESLIAWLEMQPADKHYDYLDFVGRCALCQYLAYSGLAFARNYIVLVNAIGDDIAYLKPHTFGALLTRARAVLTEKAGA